MISKLTQPLLPTDKIVELVQIEPALLLLGLSILSWLFYRIFLRTLSQSRHQRIRNEFRNLFFHLILGSALFLVFLGISRMNTDSTTVARILPYAGFAALLSGVTIFIKICRIYTYEYLYLVNMKAAFPLLIVNLLTLALSLMVAAWIATVVFNVRLAPVLATSAIVSLVFGLAVQDTLGNLFSGVAMQFDKPYEIGDWIEIQHDGMKWTGQVKEISWRATLLSGFGQELITVPNRIVGQSEVANYCTRLNPVFRIQFIKIPYDYPVATVRRVLTESMKSCPGVLKDPEPYTLVAETTESWISYKLVYLVENFGLQYRITDAVLTRALEALEKARIPVASSRMLITRPEPVIGKDLS